MLLSDFFRRAGTKKIVINTDIDGFLSGMILQKYYDCEVVGFSNSKDCIWLTPDITSIHKPVYIDIFINTPKTYCIDQHIVAYDNAQLERILAYRTKMNPNLDVSKRTYSGDLGHKSDYFHKYPFGTVHYLIALMKRDCIDVKFNDLGKMWKVKGADSRRYDVCPAQIILRADNALFSSLGPYKENTDIWWDHLKQFNSKTIDDLIDYKNSCDKSRNDEYRRKIGDFFVNGLECDGEDGAFNRIAISNKKALQPRVIAYNRIINKILGINMNLPTEVIEHRGIAQRSSYNSNKMDKAFTYAFVCSPNKPDSCFSYTTDFDKIL